MIKKLDKGVFYFFIVHVQSKYFLALEKIKKNMFAFIVVFVLSHHFLE